MTHLGESVQSRPCGRSRPVRINDILAYRMEDMEIVDRAGGRPVYTVDYFTSAVTPQYLESLQEEFQIPGDIDMVVLVPNDHAFSTAPRLRYIVSGVLPSRAMLDISSLS